VLAKLGAATGAGVVTVGYPGGVEGLEGRELPPGSPVPAGSVVVVFTETRSRFDERSPLLAAAAAADLGLRTVAQVAVDDVWSALRLRPS